MTTPHNYMTLMPGSVVIENAPTNQTMTEVWKGPWSELRKLTDLRSSSTIFGVRVYPGLVRPDYPATTWKVKFEPSQAWIPAGFKKAWIITDVQASQQEAGDYGYLTISYETIGGAEGGEESGQAAEETTGVPTGTTQKRPTTWTLEFQQLTRSPIAYADLSDANVIQQCYSYPHPGSWAEVSADAAQLIPPVSADELPYCYMMTDLKGVHRLAVLRGEKARKIYNYMLAGVNPQFHMPVVSRDAYFALSAGDAMNCHIDDLDKKTSLPPNCPYSWSGVEWIKSQDQFNVTQSNNAVVEYQRHTTWTAAPHWDNNFYGPSAWVPQKYDTTNNTGG